MKLITMLLTALFTVPVMAADSYLCIAEHSGGVGYNEVTKEWKGRVFKTKSKYIVKKADKKSGTAWIVSDHGSKVSSSFCKKDFNKDGFLFCSGYISHFTMNKKLMRFRYHYDAGYVNFSIIEFDSPFVEIGKCSKI